MQDLSQVGHNVMNTAQKIYTLGRQLYELLNKNANSVQNNIGYNTAATAVSSTSDLPFMFTGQITDLDYFRNNQVLPKSVIESIPDENLKKAVVSNFELAEKEGLINVDLEKGIVALSDKGQQYINQPNFINAAHINQHIAIETKLEQARQMEADATRYSVNLNGTDRDLQFFRFASGLDLEEIALSSDKEAAIKVLDNIAKWEQKGWIAYNPDNKTAVLTPKGTEKLYDTMRNGTEQLTETATKINDAVSNTAQNAVAATGSISVTTKIASTALNKAAEAMLNR